MNSQPSLTAKWSSWAPYFHSLLRIIAGFLLIPAGTMKLFAFPAGMPPDGGTAEVMSQIWIGGVLELVGGVLLLIGLFTRPTAFILSGQMAVAYFMVHIHINFWPILNNGEITVLYAFLFLWLSAAGPGPWSLDQAMGRKR